MPVEKANGGSGHGWACSGEVLSLDALPAVLDQLYAQADRAGVAVRITGKATADGVELMAQGYRASDAN